MFPGILVVYLLFIIIHDMGCVNAKVITCVDDKRKWFFYSDRNIKTETFYEKVIMSYDGYLL